ncbi:NUDIX domain-containing protein [Streptomyces globisporus]|uniref:NUDIX hydrolase n=1 Tax=Streptomyces globisporus TaxID=1908 RepID=UPI001900A29F|nr:NUDIX hydrolase [Streptomyces globisporus]
MTRCSARAILLDGGDLVLIKRTKPDRDPYWVAVGGGVEATDPSIEDALHREVFEELGGKLSRAELVHLITDVLEDGVGAQYIFAARLEQMDIEARTGTEFDKPERGGYEVVRVPFTAEAIRQLNLMPRELAEFAAANIEAVKAVLDTQVRTMAEATEGKLTLGS